jgi:hypothetical protein
MTDVNVYLSGSMIFRVHDPAALVEASELTTAQVERLTTSNLSDGDPWVGEQVGRTLTREVLLYMMDMPRLAKPPGSGRVDVELSYSLNKAVHDARVARSRVRRHRARGE